MQPEILIAICVAVVIVFALLMGILSRYRSPSKKSSRNAWLFH